MSYVEKGPRLFNSLDDPPEVPRKRSDGRLKTYNSATDTRAWSDITEAQRVYILDLVKEGGGKGLTLGKYIPIDVLIDTLLSNKNAEIIRLQGDLEFMRSLLTSDQLAQFERMRGGKQAGDYAGVDAIAIATSPPALAVPDGVTPKPTSAPVPTSASAPTSAQATTISDSVPADAKAYAGGNLDSYSKEELKQMIIEKDAAIISLQNALATKEEDCANQRKLARTAIEKLETVKDIIEERNHLKKRLEESEHEIHTLKKRLPSAGSGRSSDATSASTSNRVSNQSSPESDSCEAEIQAMEREIDRLKAAKSCTPEQETEIIRKELNVLKKYCAKLSAIQAENNQLKREMGSIKRKSDDCDESDDKAALKSRLTELEVQLKMHKDTVTERDRLKARVQQLEIEMGKYGSLPEEVEVFRRRSQMLDEVMVERDSLHTRLSHLQNVEKQVAELKKKASRVEELERQLKETQANAKELNNVKAERDMLRMKAADYTNMEQEVERLRYRAKEAEVLRIERDRMKVRVDELSAIEVEFMQVLERTKCLESIKAEREMYKSKYEELLGLECECDMLRAQIDRAKTICVEKDMLEERVQECECLIAEQESEINKLLCHIDRLSQGHEEQQCLRKFMEKIKLQRQRHGRTDVQASRKYCQCQPHG